jgi:hypothetical protein
MKGAAVFERKAEAPKLLRFFSGANAPAIKPIEWLVRGLLARGAITLLAGQPGVSKSVHSFILAGSLCLGKDFAGMNIGRPYKVLYLDIDGGWVWSAQTLMAAMRGVGLEGLPENFLYWSPLDEECQFDDEQSASLEHLGSILETTVRSEKVDVVMIDSLNQFMEGDSNNNRDVVRALRGGLEGTRRAGAAILILDHTNKAARAGGGEFVPMASGGQQKRAIARITVTLEEEGEDVRWSVDKTNTAKFPPFLTHLHFSLDGYGDADVIKLELKGEAGARTLPTTLPRDEAIQTIMHILREEGGEVQRKAFGSSGTTNRALEILTESGVIEKSGYGKYRLKATLPLCQPLGSGKVAKLEEEKTLETLPRTLPTLPPVAKSQFEGEL